MAWALAVLFAAAASAQWGGSQGPPGGWWSNQSAGGTGGQQGRRRPAAQGYAPQQQYAPQPYNTQQLYPAQGHYQSYYPSNQPNAQRPFVASHGRQQRQQRRREPPTLAYAPPTERASRSTTARGAVRIPKLDEPGEPAAAVTGGATMFCVRLCDGRFFPLSGEAGATPDKMCSALCPASRTKVFEGGSIDESTAADGSRYEKLRTAFLYRKELIADCTCNGKNVFGLARIDIKSDPTLQAGDIVVMADGLKVFTGMQGRRHRTARFTSIRTSALVSGSFRRTLNRVTIARTRPDSRPQQRVQR